MKGQTQNLFTRKANSLCDGNWRLPTRKNESWRYTSVQLLEKANYLAQPFGPTRENIEPSIYTIPRLDAFQLVFVDGQLNTALSQLTQLNNEEGVIALLFSEANENLQQIIRSAVNSCVDLSKHPFALLNNNQTQEGVYVAVEKGVRLEKPIQIVNLTTERESEYGVAPRLFVDLAKHAEATIIEHFLSIDEEQNAFVNGLTELQLAEGSRLNYYRLNCEDEASRHIAGIHANLEDSACLNCFCMSLGGSLKRFDVNTTFSGAAAHCELNGIYLPRGNQHIDFHTCVEHAVPRCSSEQNFRGIVADSARAVFNGRIHIHENAPHTNAHMNNRNLLTSNKAEGDTKPELEIYTDDVQCSHGATVAQLDSEAVAYLQSRGIELSHARRMLSFGFINQLIENLDHQAIAEYLRPITIEFF